MMTEKTVALTVFVAGLTVAGGCKSQSAPEGKLTACVSILPQAHFVEQVGGQHVNVEVLVGPGRSPHNYEPTPKQMATLSDADVYFSIGVPFERRLLEKLEGMDPDLRVVDTRKGIKLRAMKEHDQEHGEAHVHGDDMDPHVWLNPRAVKVIADHICDALVELDSKHAGDYKANLDAFKDKLGAVDKKITEALRPFRGEEFMVFHPAYGYFGEAYGLEQVPVEVAGKEPTAKQLADLIQRAKQTKVRIIFVQPQFSQHSAESVAKAIGGVVVPIDPLAKDYLNNLERMAAEIKKAMAASKEGARS